MYFDEKEVKSIMNKKTKIDDKTMGNDRSPEEILKEMVNQGVISEQQYKEALYKFEDLDDRCNLSRVDIYKKAYTNGRIGKCVEEILNMHYEYKENFRKVFLISDCLKNPLGFSFNEEDYNLTMKILLTAKKCAEDDDYSKEFIRELMQFALLTHVLFENNKTNAKRLSDNTFSEYSLSEQLRMMCIFIQDQNRLMKQMSKNQLSKNDFTTGMEMIVADKSIDNYANVKVSLVDNYEGLLEYFDTLMRFLYATKKEELKTDTTQKHGDIHPFKIPSFQELIAIAQQRVMYLKMESKFRYSNWELCITNSEDDKDVALFKAKHIEKYQAHIVAGIRRRYQLTTKCIKNAETSNLEYAMDAIGKLSDEVDIDKIENWGINKELYSKAKSCVSVLISSFKTTTKAFYLKCKFKNIQVMDVVSAYEYLYTFSRIYITCVYKRFNEKNYSQYKYLVPVIEIDYIIAEFAKLYDLDLTYAKKVIQCFVFDNSIRNDDGDIFSRPLIKISKDKILFCESLIEQINLERCIELLLLKYKVNIAPMGIDFENKLVTKLLTVPGIQVNTNRIAFHAYDEKDVEFDFIGTLEDYLLLFEFKSVTIPYDDKHLYKNENTIKEGVDQVLRRCKVIQYDWDKIRELANIELPAEPYSEEKIIKVVCTNIFDFTTLRYSGVRVTDESTLLKYFTDPFVGVFSSESSMGILNLERIWKYDKPTVEEFINYLDNPVTVECIHQCLKEEVKPVPYFKKDFPVAFVDLQVIEDPYKKAIKQKIYSIKKIKVGRNDKCTCGSGLKYKRCCGKKI